MLLTELYGNELYNCDYGLLAHVRFVHGFLSNACNQVFQVERTLASYIYS